MAAASLVIDIRDWDSAAGKLSLSEESLVAVLNAKLSRRPDLACAVIALHYKKRCEQNWAVAKFRLGPCTELDDDARFLSIAAILVAAADDFDVAWPSTVLH